MSYFRRIKLTFEALRSCTSRIITTKAPPQPSASRIHQNWTRNPAKFSGFSSYAKFCPHLVLQYPVKSLLASGTRMFVDRYHREPWLPRKLFRKLRTVLIVVLVGPVVCVIVAIPVDWVSTNKFFNPYEGNFETIPYSRRKHFVLLTKSMEIHEGEDSIKRKKRKLKDNVLPRTHPESIRVRKIANDIIESMQKDLRLRHDYNRWEILVVEQSEVLAYCFAGGKIIVNTGLLRHFSTDTEIAAILAHEIAHVVARHHAEGIKLLGIRVSDESLSKTLSFLLLPFNRRHEIEADYIGLMLMAAAGYDPRIAPQVWEELGKNNETGLYDDLLSTHPSGRKRAQLLSHAHVMEKALAIYQENSWKQRLS